jgi:hypothetical protein
MSIVSCAPSIPKWLERITEAESEKADHIFSIVDKASSNSNWATTYLIFYPELHGFPSCAIKELGTLNSLYTTTNAMAVWPFDTKTAIRYGGLLISPLSPIVASQISNITKWIKSYLGM